MKDVCCTYWKMDYLPAPKPDEQLTFFDAFLATFLYCKSPNSDAGELESFVTGKPIVCKSSSYLKWWWDRRTEYPTLYQDALDTLLLLQCQLDSKWSSAVQRS